MLTEYETQSTLNPKLWEGDRLKKGLRHKFLRIAKAFFEFLEIDEVPVIDVILIGSNANYNWTDKSDIDLHIIIDHRAVGSNVHLVKNYMMAKKSIWFNNYPLTYKGMDIELYAQDSNTQLHSSVGQYSLMQDKWLKKPNADVISIDDEIIEAKAAPLEYEINNLDKDDPQLEYKLKTILSRLYKMRKTGLEAEGEYSAENLAFKKLRNEGLLAHIKQLSKEITMNQLRVEAVVEEQYDTVVDELAAHITKRKLLDGEGWQRVMKYTDAVADSEGQLKHPGKCTMIPSGNITMNNVNYKVLGIDDTGDTKMMHPDNDYGYPGGQVFEIPVTPEQNTLLKKLRIRLHDMNVMTEQDFAGPFGKEHNYADYGGPWGTGHHHKTDFKKGPGKTPTKGIGSGRSQELANMLKQTGYKK